MKQKEFDELGEPNYVYPDITRGTWQVRWYWRINGHPYVKNMTRARYIYQKNFGVLPSNIYIIHKSDDITDDSIENLEKITKSELGYKRLAEERALPHKIINGEEHRKCGKCKQFLPLNRFAKRSRNNSKGLNPWCMKCANHTEASKKARKRYQLKMKGN